MIVVNADGYISELPAETATLEFRSGDGRAGNVYARDADGNKLELRFLAAEFNLPQHPWWERLSEAAA